MKNSTMLVMEVMVVVCLLVADLSLAGRHVHANAPQ